VMLIKDAGAIDEQFSTERASSFCAAADISQKCLYILAQTHHERVHSCVQR